jgi:hypothetical protein
MKKNFLMPSENGMAPQKKGMGIAPHHATLL